jgi:hypothetical protein
MGLPDPDSAKTWGGKLLVDRDGAEIGTCTEIFVDDATGLPEWAAADVSGGPAFIPLIDAAESGDRVRVAVRQADVADAPPVGDFGHISEDEEARLYRHYGIEFSRESSDSLLPVDGPTVPAEATSSPPAESAPSLGTVEPADDALATQRRALLPTISAGVVGALAVVAAAVFWWRRRVQAPPTRKELLAARAHAASLAVGLRRTQLAAAAAPLLQSGRRFSAAAAQQAAVRARAAADRAAVQARVVADRGGVRARAAADRAAVQARAAAEQAAVIAATARTLRLQRVPQVQPEPVATASDGRRRVLAALQTAAGFAAGYAVGARGKGSGLEQLRQRPQVQQAAGRVRAGMSRASSGVGGVTERVRRRSDIPVPDGDSGTTEQ